MSRDEKLISRHEVKVIGLLFIIILASVILILTNYASLKITSAVRSYINGESQYSKAQKDATTNLILYVTSEDDRYWKRFQQEISVPIGDSIARTAMIKDGNENVIKEGLIQGRNKEEDLDEMIWLFNNFKNISFMREAILIWKNADVIVGQLADVGTTVHERVNTGAALSSSEKEKLIQTVNEKDAKLTILERAFSDSLATAARSINTYLFLANLIMIVFIIGTISIYTLMMIKKLREANVDLILINQELDKFVYSASHDLRAPISSLKGLISLVAVEKDQSQLQHYLKLMTFTLNKQDQFIREIIDFSRNKKTKVEKIEVSLNSIINQAILQHQHMPNACTIEIKKDLQLDVIQSDAMRLDIVIKNLISNSLKYHDPGKKDKFVLIRTSRQGNNAIISVEDNGIGIDEKYLDRIFEMFFVTDHTQNGSGLGLYLTSETVSKLNGSIDVISEKGKGSTFTVTLRSAL